MLWLGLLKKYLKLSVSNVKKQDIKNLIDFILNEEGSLKGKVFNKENEFNYIGDEAGYTQGIGISYDVNFNNFKSLL